MEITEIRKKLKQIKSLTDEFDMIEATLRSIGKLNTHSGIKLDENYLFNMEKRKGIILKQLNDLLK